MRKAHRGRCSCAIQPYRVSGADLGVSSNEGGYPVPPTFKPGKELLVLVKLMLQYGANPKLRNNGGQDCIQFATGQGFLQCAEVVLSHKEEPEHIKV